MASSPKLLSRIEVRTFLIYPPDPKTDGGVKAKLCVLGVKQDGRGFSSSESMIEFAVRRLKETAPGTVLEPLFEGAAVLVPAPGSAPLRKKGGPPLWSNRRLCEEMVANGLGSRVLPLLERVIGVPKSAYVRKGEQRPGPALHAKTVEVTADLAIPEPRIILVDDVLTRGATMLGFVSRLTEVYPEHEIMAFALSRTSRDAEGPIDPAIYKVRLIDDENCSCTRKPRIDLSGLS